MLTTYDLSTEPGAILRHLDAAGDPRAENRTVETVRTLGPHWYPPEDTGSNGLIIAPPADERVLAAPRTALRALASRGSVAVAVADPALPLHAGAPAPVWATAELLAAAHGCGLPLLVATRPCTVPELQALVLEALAEALTAQVRQTADLLAETRRLDRQGEGPGPLLRWLADQTDSTVTVITRDDGTWAALAEHGRVLEQLLAGQVDSAAVAVAGRHMRLHAMGAAVPRQVLAAVRDTPWPRRASELVAQAASQVALLRHPLSLRAQERRLKESAMAVKVAVIQHLVAGDVPQAIRTAAPLLPDLFRADVAEVCVVECGPGEERAAVAEACDAALERRALVACPVEYQHVLVLHPRGKDAAAAADLLRPVIAAHGQRAAGISQPVPWTDIESAHTAAKQALIRAHRQESRTWVDEGATPLAHRLSLRARAWAAGLLAPLRDLPEADRRELVGSARLALSYGPSRAAELLDREETGTACAPLALDGTDLAVSPRLHRNTLSRRLADLTKRVGLDRSQLAHRAVLHLALDLDALPAPPPGTASPSLREVLGESGARDWVTELLAPLAELEDPAGHLGALTTWAECNGRLQDAADALGRHRNTLTRTLAEVSSALSRTLSETGRDQHDVLLALVIDRAGEHLLDTLPPFAIAAAPPGDGERVNGGRMHDDDHGAEGHRSASSARLYNAFGGGKDNYSTDTEIAQRIMGIWPEVREAALSNRAFIGRSARWLTAEVGIRQFLDIGTGIPDPRSPHLHQVVQETAPDARVLYTDNDPMVLAHAQALLTSTPEGRTAYLHADATDPGTILTSPELADTLDMSQPVALYLCALLHLIRDEQDPAGIVRRLVAALAPGSVVVLTHATDDFAPEMMAEVEAIYNAAGRGSVTGQLRSREVIEGFMDGLELVAPGVVPVHRWRPETSGELLENDKINAYALVARKP
ncbi:hypothetical protein CUT44_14255 [Streptomyces carminius]|uniref:Uncharacterized protein n=1 Tax=Streptomyces carminius TaxID=2665496 RepID=A0A2M8LYX3_9ACTN|nr:SAM-dependent methyltransferase [Streptomyces carminius]PJE97140.1 hypothetical protein CUT44_14255 [Streptomyces carminius]